MWRAVGLLWLVAGMAPAWAQVGTAIGSGQTVTVNMHGQCRTVGHSGSGTRMVFTGTSAEWSSFYTNPSGLTIGSCSTRDPASGYYQSTSAPAYHWMESPNTGYGYITWNSTAIASNIPYGTTTYSTGGYTYTRSTTAFSSLPPGHPAYPAYYYPIYRTSP